MQKSRRLPATVARAGRTDTGNQMAYVMAERLERDALKKKVLGQNKRLKPTPEMQRARAKSQETGANAGTVGGSRSLTNAFFGKKR